MSGNNPKSRIPMRRWSSVEWASIQAILLLQECRVEAMQQQLKRVDNPVISHIYEAEKRALDKLHRAATRRRRLADGSR